MEDQINRKKQSKAKAIILCVLFLLAIYFPFVNYFAAFVPEPVNMNFNYAPKPELDPEMLDIYPNRFEKYYTESFGLRTFLIKANTYFKVKILGVSPNPARVIVGKENWLFSAERALTDYRGTNVLTPEEQQRLAAKLHKRAVWLNKQGITFYLVFVPSKFRIYPEYLPDNIVKSDVSVLDQTIGAISNDTLINIINLRETILSRKKDHLLYYKKDNHWNDYGAYYGYKAIIERIQKKYPGTRPTPLQNFTLDTSRTLIGGEALMIDVDEMLNETRVMLKSKTESKAVAGLKKNYPVTEGFPYPDDFEIQKTIANDSLPTAVIIRDSFTDFMLPFLQENFKRSTFIFDSWQYKWNKKIVENEKPQIVILEVIEPNIRMLLEEDADEN